MPRGRSRIHGLRLTYRRLILAWRASSPDKPFKMKAARPFPSLALIFFVLIAKGQSTAVPDTGTRTVVSGRGQGLIELQAIHTGEHIPFWMRSLQHGNIPLQGTSMAAIGSFERDYVEPSRKTDFGYGIRLRGDLGKESRFTVLEAYVKARFRPFELRAGRFRQVLGLSDPTLGMGNFSHSGNALPIPMIQLGLPDYSLPIFDSLISFKGTFSQGWMGETRTEYMNRFQTLPEFLHQKSLHIRIGKPRAAVKGILGLVHEVLWVDNDKLYGDDEWGLSPLQTYFYIVTAKRYMYKPGLSETTTIGNNLGHFDLGIQIDARNSEIMLYRQIFYESARAFSDGITGVCIRNTGQAKGKFHLDKAVLEFMSSMDQAYDGSLSPPRYDSYYNHEWLYDGVSYKGMGIGNPFISMKSGIRSSFPSSSSGLNIISFSNTRVRALNLGAEWSAGRVFFRNRASFSWNYGTYDTQNTFPPSSQFSMSMEAGLPFKRGWQARALFAFDSGELLYNTSGGFLSMAKVF